VLVCPLWVAAISVELLRARGRVVPSSS